MFCVATTIKSPAPVLLGAQDKKVAQVHLEGKSRNRFLFHIRRDQRKMATQRSLPSPRVRIGFSRQVFVDFTSSLNLDSGTYSGAARVGFGLPVEAQSSAPVELCPFLMKGECRFEERCVYVHGEYCDICFLPCLVPGDEVQQMKHKKVSFLHTAET